MSSFDRQAILDCLSRLVTPGIKLTALADEVGARKQDYSELRSTLLELVEEGTVVVLPGGAFALAPRGRAADPAAKPVPPAPPPEPRRPASGVRRPDKKQHAAKEVRAKKPAPPWGASRGEEYDPETGEMKPVRLAKPDAGRRTPDADAVGRITVHPAGYGFVQTDSGETVFVPAKYRGNSLDGDRVEVDTWPGVRGTEGRVTHVLARGRERLTGVIRRVGRATYLAPDDPRIAADF
ncbi:MAG: hypothetical protein ACM31C_08745, partial [Acidobacteriota bacterium]